MTLRHFPSMASAPAARARANRCMAVLGAAAALWGATGPADAQAVAPAPANVMNLATTASADVPMDLLAITFSTTREGSDAAAVQQQLRQALDAALAEARKAARPGQVDVRTGNLALSPRYAPKGGLSGWQGSVQLHIEGRDMAAISQLAGRIGTLSIAQVRQGLSREAREKAEADTTTQAIARFRERAQAQAQLFGFSGYTIREVSVNAEGGGFAPPVVAFKARAAGAAVDESLPVEAGKTTVTVSVSGSVTMTR